MIEQEQFLCGKWLGSGIHRAVYECSFNDKWVIKLALGEDGRKMNLIEEKISYELGECDLKKWFAKVIDVSEAGLLLIMEKAEMGRIKDYPGRIPHFFTDLKRSNYGWIGNRFVCVDYASTIITNGFTSKMKKVDWYDI